MKRTGRSTGRPKGSTNHDPKIKEVMSELFQQGFRRDYVARVTGMSDGYVKNWEGEENFVGDSEIIALGGASNETKDRPLG